MAVVLLCLVLSRASWLSSTAMEAKEDVTHASASTVAPPLSLLPPTHRLIQFIFYGEQHALSPPSALACAIGFANAQSYHGWIVIYVTLLPILLLFVVFVIAFSDAYAHAVADPVATAATIRRQATAITMAHRHCHHI
jgi:hypothetical protein